jgi:predicted RNA-binding protein
MCLSTVDVSSEDQRKEVMSQVAYIEAKNNGFLCIDLLGDKKYVQGKIISLDFVDDHSVILDGDDEGED